MQIEKLSKKQGQVLRFIEQPESMLIADGSVRSGKTTVMTMAFIIWAMEYFDRTNFAICGKTVTSAERNIIKPVQQIENLPYLVQYRRSDRLLIVRCGKKVNYFYVFGGKDESSYALIQGITLAGVLFDEVALMPQSFVDQAIARTLTYQHAKLWFNCNPEHPRHWFYQNFILKPREDAIYLHFLMSDNPIMSKEEIDKAAKMFTGVFYQRYILGLWVRAEGIIFRLFADDPDVFFIEQDAVPPLRYIHIGVDFGGNKSGHAFVASGITRDWKLIVLRSQRLDAKGIDTDELIAALIKFADGIKTDYGYVDGIYCDSAEQTIINSIRNRAHYAVYNSLKNPIVDRIRATSLMMAAGRLKLIPGQCESLISALAEARWDDKQKDDVRLDDGTSDIDSLDAFEYSWEYYIRQLVG